MQEFARGCMRTYLILKEKAAQWRADGEIQGLLAELNADDGASPAWAGGYSAAKAAALKGHAFDRRALGARDLGYERLDQLTVDLLLGAR